MKGLYVHIPFCVRKCEYCDFISFPHMEKRFDEYINAVVNEMNEYKNEKIDTIFFGGGTPSVLNDGQIARLCNAIKMNFDIDKNVEWTIEVNPGTITKEKAKIMLQYGINRISVGIQSFDDNELKAAGRIHDAKTALNTIEMLYKTGFQNISIDIMESLPLQTKESFENTLKIAISLPVKHISVYSLIIEDGTPLKEKYDSGIYAEPDEDLEREMYHFTKKILSDSGFERYEVSNYSKNGFESKHNLKYWNCDEYIGLGIAAHSYINGIRFSNTDDFEQYINGNYRSGNVEILDLNDKIGEFMMLGLRKTCGINTDEFKNRFKKDVFEIFSDVIDKYLKQGFLEINDKFLRFTEKGIDIENMILCEFV